MKFRQEFRKIFKFLQQQEQGHDEHGNNGYIMLSGKKYFVGKMSYDEWYLEPYRKGRTERDSFDKNTLWEGSDAWDIIQLFIDNNLLTVIIE